VRLGSDLKRTHQARRLDYSSSPGWQPDCRGCRDDARVASVLRQPDCMRERTSWHAAIRLGCEFQRLVHPGLRGSLQRNVGGSINFKINSPASSYSIDIHRTGYYGGDGARLIASITPNIPVSQSQPACNTNTVTGLVDCGNWEDDLCYRGVKDYAQQYNAQTDGCPSYD
jgi:hypothetical protein